MLPFPLKILGYNPLAANCEDRILDIVDEASNFDLVLLAGTGVRKHDQYSTSVVRGRKVISTGFLSTTMSNKSCGVSIVLGKKFRNARVYDPLVAPPKIAGRGLAVRAANGFCDVTAICVYFPPSPRDKSKIPVYRETCREIASWLSAVLCKVPASSTPVLYTDLNDGMGLKAIAGAVHRIETSAVSEGAARLERFPGAAGELLRELLDTHGMASASSWTDSRPTFFGNNHSESLLDHICLPLALIEAVRTAGPLYSMARKLQLIRRRSLADHSPVHVVAWYLFSQDESTEELQPQLQVEPSLQEVTWDLDELLLGLRKGKHRREFIAALESEMETFIAESAPLLEQATPDSYFTQLDAVVIKCAQRFFSKSAARRNEEVDQLAERRLDLLRQRREIRSQLGNASAEEESRISLELDRVTKLSRGIRRQVAKAKQDGLIEELWEYWRARRLAECHRVMRALQGSKSGPKMRRYSALRTALPTRQQWMEVWSQKGHLGGMEATSTDWNTFLQTHESWAPQLPDASLNHLELAKRDVKRLREHVVYSSKRKSAPLHSIPSAVLSMILAPNWRMQSPEAKKQGGLGAELDSKVRAPNTRLAFVKGYSLVNRSGLTPLKWHFSWGAAIPKHNNKSGALGKRVVHRLDEQGKAFFAGKMRASQAVSPLPVSNHSQGFVARRRRESGVIAQQSVMWRAKRAGKSGALLNLDMANAFASTEWEVLESHTPDLFLPEDEHFVDQRYSWASVQLPASDGDFLVRSGSGALMGDQYAVFAFLASYEAPTNRWNFTTRLIGDDPSTPGFFHCWPPGDMPANGKSLTDLSFTKYADDLDKFILGDDGDLMSVFRNSTEALLKFDQAVQPSGFHQNHDKMVAVLVASGPGSRTLIGDIRSKRVEVPFRCELAAKSLGSFICHDGRSQPEVDARIAAVSAAFFRRGMIWTKPGLPWKLKRIMIMCDIQGTALAGLEAFVISEWQASLLDSAVVRVCRVAMRGQAAKKDQSGQVVSSMSNLDVLRFWKLSTCSTELAIRRLKWYQHMVLYKDDSWLPIAAIFGHCRGEANLGIPAGVVDGRIAVNAGATPWAAQFAADFDRLQAIDEGADLLSSLGEKIFNVFVDPDLGAAFTELDVSNLRAAETSIAIPPPEFSAVAGEDRTKQPEDLPLFPCPVCDCWLQNRKALLAHVGKSHGLQNLAHLCTVTNQCCICHDTFASRVTASRHFQLTLNRGHCNASKTYNLKTIAEPSDLCCPLPNCAFETSELVLLQRHLAGQHFPWLFPDPPIAKPRQHGPAGARNAALHGAQGGGGAGRRRRLPEIRSRQSTQAASHTGHCSSVQRAESQTGEGQKKAKWKWKFTFRKQTGRGRRGHGGGYLGKQGGLQGGQGHDGIHSAHPSGHANDRGGIRRRPPVRSGLSALQGPGHRLSPCQDRAKDDGCDGQDDDLQRGLGLCGGAAEVLDTQGEQAEPGRAQGRDTDFQDHQAKDLHEVGHGRSGGIRPHDLQAEALNDSLLPGGRASVGDASSFSSAAMACQVRSSAQVGQGTETASTPRQVEAHGMNHLDCPEMDEADFGIEDDEFFDCHDLPPDYFTHSEHVSGLSSGPGPIASNQLPQEASNPFGLKVSLLARNVPGFAPPGSSSSSSTIPQQQQGDNEMCEASLFPNFGKASSRFARSSGCGGGGGSGSPGGGSVATCTIQPVAEERGEILDPSKPINFARPPHRYYDSKVAAHSSGLSGIGTGSGGPGPGPAVSSSHGHSSSSGGGLDEVRLSADYFGSLPFTRARTFQEQIRGSKYAKLHRVPDAAVQTRVEHLRNHMPVVSLGNSLLVNRNPQIDHDNLEPPIERDDF